MENVEKFQESVQQPNTQEKEAFEAFINMLARTIEKYGKTVLQELEFVA